VGKLLTGFKERAVKAKTAATEMVSDDNLAELIVNVTHKLKRINAILEGGVRIRDRILSPKCFALRKARKR